MRQSGVDPCALALAGSVGQERRSAPTGQPDVVCRVRVAAMATPECAFLPKRHTHTHTHTQQVLDSFMRTCCAQAPWSGRTASNALAWMQSRYVNGCTRFLCFGARPCERIMVDVCRPASPRCLANLLRLIHASPPGDRLEAGLQRLCASSSGLAHENAAPKPARHGVDNDAAGCALVRQVYAADWRTWRTHCAAGVVVGVLGQHKVGL